MERSALVLPASLSFEEFLTHPELSGRMQHIVIAEGNRIVGVQRVNRALRHGLEGKQTGVILRNVARKN